MISYDELLQQNQTLRDDLNEAREMLEAIRTGEVDALVVSNAQGNQIFTLKSADQPYRVLVEEMKDGALTLADDGTILYCNRYFAAMVDRPPGEILSHSIYEYFVTQDVGRLQDFLRAAQHEHGMHEELNLRSPGGEVMPIHLAANTLQFDEAQVTCLVITDLRAQKRREEALLESERFARSTVDALSAQIAILDETGTIMAVNQEWRNFAKSNGGDLNAVWEGENYLTICDAASAEVESARIIAKGIRKVIEENRSKHNKFIYEYASHTPTEQRWFVVRITPFAGDGPMRVVVAYENVTERKLVESALLDVHQQLVVLNRVMTQTNATLETDVILEIACKELGQVFAMPQVVAALINNDAISLTISAEYVRGGHKSAIGETLSWQLESVRGYIEQYKTPFAMTNARQDSRVAFFEDFLIKQGINSLLVIPLWFHDKFLGTIGVYTDEQRVFTESEMTLAGSVAQVISQSLENSLLHQSIANQNIQLEHTVEKRTHQLKLLNERTSTILNNTSDAIILTLSNGQIENTNLAFDHLFAYASDEMCTQSIGLLSSSADRERMLSALSQVAQNNHHVPHLQVSAVRKDGSTFDADCGLAFVNDGEGFIVWSIRDITHLKIVERMKDQFVSMVSHELRTPLTSMVLSASSLQRHYDRLNDQKRRETIDRLNDQGAVMVNLIEGILDLSRIDAQLVAPGEALIDMRLVIEKVILQLQDSINAKNHTLKIKLDVPSTLVTGSDIDFTRVWRNLVSNAIKYTPDGGMITLSLGLLSIKSQTELTLTNSIIRDSLKLPTDILPGRYLIGQVTDTGRGIPPKDLEQLFSRFFRGSASQSNIPGTGLGLALVRDLLNLYGGNISVDSHLNSGSSFTFWLPMDKESSS